jgi:hypothetical protein
VDRAIEIAKRLGMPLKVAAKVDEVDREYFEGVVEPLMRDPLIEFVGEIGKAKRRSSSETPARFSSRSTGRSRSGS